MGDGFETGKAGGAVLLAQLRLVEALPQTEAWAKLMSVNENKNNYNLQARCWELDIFNVLETRFIAYGASYVENWVKQRLLVQESFS